MMIARAAAPTAARPADQAVRGRLLAAAVDLFNRTGYAATTVGRIVAAAGVSKPALYYYFRNKEGIFLEIMREGSDRFLGIVERHRTDQAAPPSRRLRSLCGEVFALLLEHLHVMRMMYAIYYGPPQGSPHVDFERFHRSFHVALRTIVEQGMRRGDFCRSDPATVVLAIDGVLSAGIQSHLSPTERPVGPAQLDRALQIVLRGLAPEPPSKRRRS